MGMRAQLGAINEREPRRILGGYLGRAVAALQNEGLGKVTLEVCGVHNTLAERRTRTTQANDHCVRVTSHTTTLGLPAVSHVESFSRLDRPAHASHSQTQETHREKTM
jgi:hypothetical protein